MQPFDQNQNHDQLANVVDNKPVISVFGVMPIPNSAANVVFNGLLILSIAFLVDLFFDKNPIKAFYTSLFTEKKTPIPS